MNYMTKDLPKCLKYLLAKQFQLLEPMEGTYKQDEV